MAREELLKYFSFQAMLHKYDNKGRGMYYFGCGIVHVKDALMLI